MLHSSFVAPCQLWAQGINDMESISYNYSKNNYLRNINFEQKLPEKEVKIDPTNIQSEPTVPQNITVSTLINTTVMSFEIMPDIQEGIIGVTTADPLDDASDNLFKFNIHNIPKKKFKAYLNYELFGVQDKNAVARSFNDRPSTGGYIVKNNNSWTNQNEEINIEWLNIGENKLMFSIPNGSLNQYKVRNVKLIFKENKNNLSPALIVNNSEIPYTKDNHLYIKGFLKDYKKTSVVYAGETKLQMVDGEYEGLVILSENNKTKNFLSIKAYDESGLVGQEIISLTKKIEADHIFPIEQQIKPSINFVKAITSSTITTEDVSIKIPETALLQNKEISISRLRKIDIAPLPAGLINVTKGGYAFRFLPDGTKFEDLISLKIPYDEKLVPKGHNINEIKTFYFNTETKAWTSVERDSINKSSKTVISSTNHFTDYINGIIQTPESPETSSFTSNMMNE